MCIEGSVGVFLAANRRNKNNLKAVVISSEMQNISGPQSYWAAMLSGHRLPRPSAVVSTRPGNASFLGTPATGHGRRSLPCTLNASTKPPDEGPAHDDARARIAAARMYRETSQSGGAPAEVQSSAADVTLSGADAVLLSDEEQSGPAEAGESVRLNQAVTQYGDAWAEKLQDQFTAAREQLSSRALPGSDAAPRDAASPASESSLADLVLERLNKRKLAADTAAAGADLASSNSTGSGAGDSRFDRGSATQAAGFLAGLAARTMPASAAPNERPGLSSQRRDLPWHLHNNISGQTSQRLPTLPSTVKVYMQLPGSLSVIEVIDHFEARASYWHLALRQSDLCLAEDFTARKFEEQKRTAEIITIEKVHSSPGTKDTCEHSRRWRVHVHICTHSLYPPILAALRIMRPPAASTNPRLQPGASSSGQQTSPKPLEAAGHSDLGRLWRMKAPQPSASAA